MNSLGIYIHVPFCGKKCGYCDFYSESYNKLSSDSYISAVLRNISHYSDTSRTVDTIYFGGGTPSLLTAAQISEILAAIQNSFCISDDAEITLEANPNTVTQEKLSELRKTGVNRLSFGVQSFSDKELEFLGRTHSAERAVKAVHDASAAGFDNISCDLMLGIPMQTAESLEYSVNRLVSLPVRHISSYILKVEDGTPFCSSGISDLLPDDDATAGLYLKMVTLLEKHGFMQYEVSNFAEKGFESRHNCRYWNCLDYIGIGPSAHSCFGGKRFACERSLASFIGNDIQPTFITDNAPCGFEERSMLALRLKKGLDITQTGSRRDDIEKKIPGLIKAGYAVYDGRFLSLTPEGFLVSNSVIEHLIF